MRPSRRSNFFLKVAFNHGLLEAVCGDLRRRTSLYVVAYQTSLRCPLVKCAFHRGLGGRTCVARSWRAASAPLCLSVQQTISFKMRFLSAVDKLFLASRSVDVAWLAAIDTDTTKDGAQHQSCRDRERQRGVDVDEVAATETSSEHAGTPHEVRKADEAAPLAGFLPRPGSDPALSSTETRADAAASVTEHVDPRDRM